MTIYKLPVMEQISEIPEGCVAALGFFDGVHAGHRAIISAASEAAAARGSYCVVWTIASEGFYRDSNYSKTTEKHATENASVCSSAECAARCAHDSFKGGSLLTDDNEKAALFYSAGAKYAVFADFRDIKSIGGFDFVKTILSEKLKLSCVVCGYNFRFGSGASCTSEELGSFCAQLGIGCITIPPITTRHGELISSSKIRKLIHSGDVESAGELLCRPHGYTLPVIYGKRLGRLLGFPTINQIIPDKLIWPAKGVYVCSVSFYDSAGLHYKRAGALNVGICPTIEGDVALKAGVTPERAHAPGAANAERAVCETYIIGYSGDLYGQTVRVELLSRLRGERKFSDVEALKRQIKLDAEMASEYYTKIKSTPHQKPKTCEL